MTQKKDVLSALARFYLGPFATQRVLLEANPSLASMPAVASPFAAIYMEEGLSVRVPVPVEWLVDRFAHRLATHDINRQGEQGAATAADKLRR